MTNTKRVIVLIALFIGMLPFVGQVKAQEETTTGSGLSISPTRTDLVINQGASGDLNISVKNVTGGKIIAKVFVNDFESDGVSGEPQLITDSSVKSSSSIKDFISGIEDITMDVGETKNLTFKIEIPANASPGAYYGIIRYQAVPANPDDAEGAGQVALTASVGTIVLIDVPGEVRQNMVVEKLSAYLGDKSGILFTRKPDQIGLNINNKGNGFARPFGTVEVTDMFGSKVHSYELNNSNPRGVVLPETTRLFKDKLENVSKPGRYTITANVSHTNGGEVLTIQSTFWYLPVWFILTVLALVGALVVSGVYLYKKYVTKTTRRRK
jgi:hypothetical protein